MIRLNCGLIAETEENRKKAIALATELVELSLHDDGCIDYDLFRISDQHRPSGNLRDLERRSLS